MRFGLQTKLVTFIFLLILFVSGSIVFLISWSFERGLLDFVSGVERSRLDHLQKDFEDEYRKHQSWDFLHTDLMSWYRILEPSLGEDEDHVDFLARHQKKINEGANVLPKKNPKVLKKASAKFYRRLLLFDIDHNLLRGRSEYDHSNALMLPLYSDSRVVGYLGLIPSQYLGESLHLRFAKEQEQSMLFIVCLVVFLAVSFSVPLANHLARRIKTMTLATQKLTRGDLTVRTPVGHMDELGQLAQNFNTLAATLDKNEVLNRQWLADISHDLRTPLTILQGDIEAMQDGLRSPTEENLAILHSEVLQLNQLVSDLQMFSVLDVQLQNLQKVPLDLTLVLEDSLKMYRSKFRANEIQLISKLDKPKKLVVAGNSTHLNQIFCNLLENSFKYTNRGGTLEVLTEVENGRVVVLFQDSLPGVRDSDIDKLFDRFYRTDQSRNRKYGGTGLGLSICMKIMKMYDGSIEASPSPLGGLLVRLEFPLYQA